MTIYINNNNSSKLHTVYGIIKKLKVMTVPNYIHVHKILCFKPANSYSKQNIFNYHLTSTALHCHQFMIKKNCNCEFKISIRPTYKIQVTRVKFTTISKILNTSQMLIIISLPIHYSMFLLDTNPLLKILMTRGTNLTQHL
jgi:hypothetical protein